MSVVSSIGAVGLLCLFITQSAAEFGMLTASHHVKDHLNVLRPDVTQDPRHTVASGPKTGKVKGTPAHSGFGFNPFAEGKHHQSSSLKCGITEKVGAHTDKYEDCPAGCPYFAQNRRDSQHCTFLCVPGEECGRWNPNKPIPDSIKNTKSCRGPMVAFCSEPVMDGTDTCQLCQKGFKVWKGHCYFEYWNVIISFLVVAAVLGIVIVVWVGDLCCRETVNQDALTKAEAWRSRSKIMKHRDHQEVARGEQRHTYHCMETNLQKDFVAGPGMRLHFRFQAFFIMWPLAVALVWVGLAVFHHELFILGTRKFGTPRHNCILVAWGYETQQRLMWTKVLFLAIVYVGSFISFLWFSVSQLRTYQQMEATEKTMKDFAVELRGLPAIPCSYADVEQDLREAIEKATSKTLIGVSIAWDYSEYQDNVELAVAKDLSEREVEVDNDTPRDIPDPSLEMGSVRRWMYNKEKTLFGSGEDSDEDPKQLLSQLVSSESAFAIFNTQQDKDSALSRGEVGDIQFDASKYGLGTVQLTMKPVENEPANINWHNFKNENNKILGFLKGFFTVYVPALLIWFFGFYVPYAVSLYNFNYDNGAELPGYYSIVFTIIVVGGNATMYVVCDICCDIIGFRYKDTKQVTYMLMYLAACMINVFLDMVVTFWVAKKVMIGLDFRTYDGTRLAEIDTFTEQFETYAMQRSLGGNVYSYCWPSTFFVCFVLEPFVTIIIPYQLGKLIVRTHAEIQGRHAEAYLLAFEFDLGRYADILLNVFLGILIFFFPGGYIWTLFFAMAFSHLYIYLFDHWKICSVIPFVKITSPLVDWWAQVVMAGCCGMILGCLVFKANCESYSHYCLQDVPLVASCTAAGVGHFTVHMILLIYLVPRLGHDGKDLETDSSMTVFGSVAREEARTWFSMNPVHCLRSKFIHKPLWEGDLRGMPHCRFAYFGKEHLLERNEAMGCFFEDGKAEAEDFSLSHSVRKLSEWVVE